MKLKLILAIFLVVFGVLGFAGGSAFAQIWIHANGGSYWTQYGSEWHSISNDGYCVSGRGPCGSSLWYLQWSWNHSGCGYDEYASWDMASYQDYNGDTYAWIDSSSGSMYGADYAVVYNYGSVYQSTVDQSPYYEAWATIALDKYRTGKVWLTDGWGANYICNNTSGYQTEFDEVKLEI